LTFVVCLFFLFHKQGTCIPFAFGVVLIIFLFTSWNSGSFTLPNFLLQNCDRFLFLLHSRLFVCNTLTQISIVCATVGSENNRPAFNSSVCLTDSVWSVGLPACLSVCLCLSVCVCLSVLYSNPQFCLPVCLPVGLFVCLPVRLSVCSLFKITILILQNAIFQGFGRIGWKGGGWG
jgi:hypothetical protein